jgi:hypothetical protein
MEGQLENIRQQTSKLSPLTKVLNVLLLLMQENCDPININIMSEAISLIETKEEMLQGTLDRSQDIYGSRTEASYPFSVFFIPDKAKQFLCILMVFDGNVENSNNSQVRLIINELSKVKNEIAARIDRINQIQTFDWED